MPVMNFNELKKLRAHPSISEKINFAQKASDKLTQGIGSWAFIIVFTVLVIVWMGVNSYFLFEYFKSGPFDPFPFILLNLILSMLAAIQAPIILMSQNREAQKDRIRAEYDYAVNRKAEKEIEHIQVQIDRMERKIDKL